MGDFKMDVTTSDIDNFYQRFDDISNQIFNSIQEMLNNGEPEKAFETLISFVGYGNLYSKYNNGIFNKLTSIVGKLKACLKQIAQKMHANAFSISVSAPIGISIGVTWNI